MKNLLGVFVFSFGLATSLYAQPGRGPMGSIANGHSFHGYPHGFVHGRVYYNPYAYWNGTGWGYGYGYGPIYGYQNAYGAIAYSTTTGIFGWAVRAPTLYDAQVVAANYCAQGAVDCQNLMWFANTCASISISRTDKTAVGWAWNPSPAIAQARSQAECRRYAHDCVNEGAVCSF